MHHVVPVSYASFVHNFVEFRDTQSDFVDSNATAILEHALPHTSDTYWNQFEKVSEYNVHLNYFEKLWMAWYAYIGNDVLATGIMSFLMHELVYFGRSLPWIIIDCIPYFNKYKIQNVRQTTVSIAPSQSAY